MMGKVINFPKGKRKKVNSPHVAKVMMTAVKAGFLGEHARSLLGQLQSEPGVILMHEANLADLIMKIAEESWIKGATEAVLATIECGEGKPRFSGKGKGKKK